MDDDGSLKFLNIPVEEGNKQFHGKVMTQQQLTNTEFYALDYTMIEKTKYGTNRMLIRIKKNFMQTAIKLDGKSLADGLLMKHRAAWFGWCKHADARNLYKRLIQKSYESK